MGIDMYLGDAQTQAAGVSTRSSTHIASYTAMIAAVEAFCAEDSLSGRAYTSAKGYCTNYVLSLLQGAILFDEALAQDCQSYVTAYESNVDSKSWREDDLRQQIANQDTLLRELADLSERASKKSVRRSLSRQIASAQRVRNTLQTILDNLLAFNASSTGYFTNSQSLYASLSSGLKEMSGSWQSSTKTYANPTSYDVTWRTVIADSWQKRQTILEKPTSTMVKNVSASTVETEVAQMPWSELRQNYLAIVKTREQSRQTGSGYAVTSADDLKRDQLIVTRYEAEAKQHTDDSHVSKAFQAKIKAMSLDELKEKYPYVNSYNPYYAHQVLFNFDKRSKAKQLYIIKRYYELESKETVSVRSQDFMGDYVKGINETGINPFTGKAVDKGTQTMAEAYQSFRAGSQVAASISAAVADFSGLFVEDNVNQTPPPNYREQVLKNIEESQRARKSSNFNKYLEIEGATKKYLSTLNDTSLEGRQYVQQWNKYAEAGISPSDRVRVLEISEKAPAKANEVTSSDTSDVPKVNHQDTTKTYISKYGDLHDYEFNGMTNPGPLAALPSTPNRNFYGGRYNTSVLQEDTILYRAGNSHNPMGQWFTVEVPNSRAQVRIDTAVKDIWMNLDGSYTGQSPIDKVYKLKIPKGTTIYEGPVGSQGGIYLGGIDKQQIFIDSPWNIEGVEVLDSWAISQ